MTSLVITIESVPQRSKSCYSLSGCTNWTQMIFSFKCIHFIGKGFNKAWLVQKNSSLRRNCCCYRRNQLSCCDKWYQGQNSQCVHLVWPARVSFRYCLAYQYFIGYGSQYHRKSSQIQNMSECCFAFVKCEQIRVGKMRHQLVVFRVQVTPQ